MVDKHAFFLEEGGGEYGGVLLHQHSTVAPYHIALECWWGTQGRQGCAYMCITPPKSLGKIPASRERQRKKRIIQIIFQKNYNISSIFGVYSYIGYSI